MRFSRPRLALILAMSVIVGYELYAFFIKTEGQAGYLPEKSATFLTAEVRGPEPLVLEFAMRADGLEAVDLFPHASTEPPQGQVTITVIQVDELSQTMPLATVAQQSAPASALAAAAPYRVRLPRLDHSSGKQYRVEIALPDAAPGHGLRFEAGWPVYTDARMLTGTRPEWGDMKFQTVAARTTIARTVARQRRTAPAFVQSGAFWVVTLIAFTCALGLLVRDLALAAPGLPASPAAPRKGGDQPR